MAEEVVSSADASAFSSSQPVEPSSRQLCARDERGAALKIMVPQPVIEPRTYFSTCFFDLDLRKITLAHGEKISTGHYEEYRQACSDDLHFVHFCVRPRSTSGRGETEGSFPSWQNSCFRFILVGGWMRVLASVRGLLFLFFRFGNGGWRRSRLHLLSM